MKLVYNKKEIKSYVSTHWTIIRIEHSNFYDYEDGDTVKGLFDNKSGTGCIKYCEESISMCDKIKTNVFELGGINIHCCRLFNPKFGIYIL